jgi:hypothetical protein
MEKIMKTFLPAMTIGILATALFGVASPSFATDTSQAIKMCDANPSCTMKWGKLNDAITIVVGGKVIDCPKKNGPCTAVRTTHLQHSDEIASRTLGNDNLIGY